MLTHSFCQIPGISVAAEQKLWAAGLQCWEHCGDHLLLKTIPVSAAKREALARGVGESRQRLEALDSRYFGDTLPSKEQWRLFSHFRDSVAYLDIETTGLSPDQSHVTTIAVYDGKRIRHYVHGQNMDDFGRDMEQYRLIVTYNGKCFDVPFIERNLGVRLDQTHIDLRYVLRSLGYKGGLKGCEKQMGIGRGELEDVDGFFAVILWNDYVSGGDIRSLHTLLAYNIQDVVNLETLLVMAYNKKIAGTPLAGRGELAMPQAPEIPFRADRRTIARLRRQMWSYQSW